MVSDKIKYVLMLLMGFSLAQYAFGADVPKYALDPDFSYFSGDHQSFRNIKYYPKFKQKYEKVFVNLRKSVESPSEGILMMHLSFALNELEEVKKIAKFVLYKNSRADDARLLLAAMSLIEHRPYQALLLLERIKDVSLKNNVANLKGLVAFQQEQPQKSIDILKAAYRSDPSNYAVAMNLGIVLLNYHKYIAAKKYFEKVIKKHRNGYDAKLHLAIVYANLGKKSKSLQLLNNLSEIFPGNSLIKRTKSSIKKSK